MKERIAALQQPPELVQPRSRVALELLSRVGLVGAGLQPAGLRWQHAQVGKKASSIW